MTVEAKPAKGRWRDKVQSILFHPKMTKTLDISNGMLDIMFKINGALTNPLTIVPAIGSTISVVKKSLAPEGVWPTVRALSLIEVSSDLGSILQDSPFLDGMTATLVAKDDWNELFMVEPEKGTVFYLMRHPKWSAASIYTVDGDDAAVKLLVRKLFRIIGGMGIELVKDDKTKVVLKSIPIQFTDHELDKVLVLANEIHECHKRGDSAAFVFKGPPGTGKTTFALSVAQLMGLSVMMIGPQAVAAISGKALLEFTGSLRPGLLIIDDVDKAGADNLQVFYTALNNLRAQFPKMVVMCSTNNLAAISEAFLRPSRGGEIKDFPPPTLEEKVELLKLHGLPAHLDARSIALMIEKDATHDWVREVSAKIARKPQATMDTIKQIIDAVNANFLLVSGLASKNATTAQPSKTPANKVKWWHLWTTSTQS